MPATYFTEAEAIATAERINAYWARRGYIVNATAVYEAIKQKDGGAWGVRSDMVNGVPVQWNWRKKR